MTDYVSIGKNIWEKTKDKQLDIIKKKREELEKEYLKDPTHCSICNKIIMPVKGRSMNKIKNQKYCSKKCTVIGRHKNNGTTKKNKNCLNCGKDITNRFSKKYCTIKCQTEFRNNIKIQDWKNGLELGISGRTGTQDFIYTYIWKKYENKCAICGWDKINPYSNKVPLELEHIDGDWKNNNEDNLTLLCPNCHSLTSTYKALNKGKGREYRYLLK